MDIVSRTIWDFSWRNPLRLGFLSKKYITIRIEPTSKWLSYTIIIHKYSLSGVRKDLMRGLSKMVLDLEETNGFSDCQEKKTISGDETRRELDCSKTSQGDSIYHIQELYSGKQLKNQIF